jgi:hypothetical protein
LSKTCDTADQPTAEILEQLPENPSEEPTDKSISNKNQSQLHGIGGWLAFYVVGQLILSPSMYFSSDPVITAGMINYPQTAAIFKRILMAIPSN